MVSILNFYTESIFQTSLVLESAPGDEIEVRDLKAKDVFKVFIGDTFARYKAISSPYLNIYSLYTIAVIELVDN